MRNALASILARVARSLAVALLIGGATLAPGAPANAGGWHGGWHGGWNGGCCWGGSSFSLFLGFPAYYPYPAYAYYPPYPAYSYGYGYGYSYPPPYYPPAPPVTVVQQTPPLGPAPVQNWYYCDDPRGYYPYVQNCDTPWRPVPAQPQQQKQTP
jgi:hypothetical protein